MRLKVAGESALRRVEPGGGGVRRLAANASTAAGEIDPIEQVAKRGAMYVSRMRRFGERPRLQPPPRHPNVERPEPGGGERAERLHPDVAAGDGAGTGALGLDLAATGVGGVVRRVGLGARALPERATRRPLGGAGTRVTNRLLPPELVRLNGLPVAARRPVGDGVDLHADAFRAVVAEVARRVRAVGAGVSAWAVV
jgi:hypothetical protein